MHFAAISACPVTFTFISVTLQQMTQDVNAKLYPGLSQQKQHLTGSKLFPPSNWIYI
jgi:hypothetical protein